MVSAEYFTFWDFFSHPLLRAPTIGSVLIGVVSGLVGVITYLKKESLIGESLSHAAYPGITLAVVFAAELGISSSSPASFLTLILLLAFITALTGYLSINFLQKRFSITPDSALCLILSTFFGIGVTLASRLQFSHTFLYKQINSYIYGQSATLNDYHVLLYLVFTSFVIGILALFYRQIQTFTFDPLFSKTSGLSTTLTRFVIYPVIALTVVLGIRSVGVVLMSAMLIAPVTSARQLTSSLKWLFPLSGLIGGLTAFLGNFIATQGSILLNRNIPTGPVIVLVAAMACLATLLFAPKDGYLARLFRMLFFRYRCLRENILKTLWKFSREAPLPFQDIRGYFPGTSMTLKFALRKLIKEGLVALEDNNLYRLTSKGRQRGGEIVRLHRLWELYLTSELGTKIDRVHPSAEEMEHIITPEIEKRLTQILGDPKFDPHLQPIPPHTQFSGDHEI